MSALIDMGTAAASVLSTPEPGTFFLFFDSENSNKLTRRNSAGNDFVLEGLAATNRIIISRASDFEGVIDPTKEYFIDGIIDMTGVSLEIPEGGAYFTGFNFDLSGFTCSDDSYTMFTSPAGGSGNILMKDLLFQVDGTGSKIFELTSVSGFEAIEITRVNFNSCTSIGDITNYRQWFEDGTGRFGGSPSLTFSEAMDGIVFKSTIVRSLDDTWNGALFQEGADLSISGRFFSDANIDLGTNSSFVDFLPSVFLTSSAFQLKDCFITRDGVKDPSDTNILPNIDASDLIAVFRKNQGTENTFIGARQNLDTEIITIIAVAGTFTPIMGTWATEDLQHFDSPFNGQLRNLGDTPFQFKVFAFFEVAGGSNDEVSIRFRRFNDSDSTTDTVFEQSFTVENNVGGNDVGQIVMRFTVSLFENDYLFPEITNNTNTTNVTVQDTSYIIIEER